MEFLWHDGDAHFVCTVVRGLDGEMYVEYREGYESEIVRLVIPEGTLAAALDWVAANAPSSTAAAVARAVLSKVPSVPATNIAGWVEAVSVAKLSELPESAAPVLHAIAESRRAPPLPTGDTSVNGALLRMGRLGCVPPNGQEAVGVAMGRVMPRFDVSIH